MYKSMNLLTKKKEEKDVSFKSFLIPDIIFKRILENSNLTIYSPLDNALIDLCKYYCNLDNKNNQAKYFENKFNECYDIWEKTNDWQNMCICSIYAFIYYNMTLENSLKEKISESISNSYILENMINYRKYDKFLIGFSLGLLNDENLNSKIKKFVDIHKNLNREEKIFSIYYYFGKKILDYEFKPNKELQNLAENIITDSSFDIFLKIPSLIFIKNPNEYYSEVINKLTTSKFYEMAFGYVSYSEEDFSLISDYHPENIVKYLIVSKILGWDNITYLDKNLEKDFEIYYKLIKEKKEIYILSRWELILVLLWTILITSAFIFYFLKLYYLIDLLLFIVGFAGPLIQFIYKKIKKE